LGIQDNTGMENMSAFDFGGNKYGVLGQGETGWASFEPLNLSPVKQVEITYGLQDPLEKGYHAELRADSPEGPLLGSVDIPVGGRAGVNMIKMPFRFDGDRAKKIYLVIKRSPGESKIIAFSSLKFLSQ
jgi:hypothetical protein